MNAYREKYLPVDPDFISITNEVIEKKKSGKVHFFNQSNEVDDVKGLAVRIEKNSEGEFLRLSEDTQVRLDRIITLFGRPGPSYAQYDSYANACLTCEDLGQF